MSGESISPLGNIGLGGGGMFSSYDPAMMAMNGYGSGLGTYGGYGMGMMGMQAPIITPFSPEYVEAQTAAIRKMYETQHQIEAQRLQQATDMHALTQQAEVNNLSAHDNAFFQKAMLDGYVQKGIREIYDAVREGNTDYVIRKYFELKNGILTNYSEYFNTAQGQKNTRENLDRLIQLLYTKIAAGYDPANPAPDLKNDIKLYGESALRNGFNTAFLGNHGHNNTNAEETLNQMFGTDINDIGSKERARMVGRFGASATELALAPVAGGTVTAAVGGVGYGVAKGLAALCGKADKVKFNGKAGVIATLIGAAIGLGADIWWQMGRA